MTQAGLLVSVESASIRCRDEMEFCMIPTLDCKHSTAIRRPSLQGLRGKIDRSIGKGIAAAHEAYRRLRRDELIYAQSLLDELRFRLLCADDWLADRFERGHANLRTALCYNFTRVLNILGLEGFVARIAKLIPQLQRAMAAAPHCFQSVLGALSTYIVQRL